LLARLGIALAALLLVLAFAELALRVVGVGQVMTYERDPRYGYLMRPRQMVSTYGDPIEINALGLRGPPLLEPKPDGVVRVLFLGDSITYGGGRIHEGELFCRRIENAARDDGFRLEAVNVSAPGWSPQNWTAWVEAHGRLDADLAVVVLPETDRARPFATLETARLVERAPALRLGTIWLRLRARFARDEPKTEDPLPRNIEALRRLPRALDGVPLVAVFLPSREPDTHPERWPPFEALFPDALDLRGKLAREHFFDDVHLSSAGHGAVAEELYARLRPTLAQLAVVRARGVR
jgi:lysophospholipase L1-like esterase